MEGKRRWEEKNVVGVVIEMWLMLISLEILDYFSYFVRIFEIFERLGRREAGRNDDSWYLWREEGKEKNRAKLLERRSLGSFICFFYLFFILINCCFSNLLNRICNFTYIKLELCWFNYSFRLKILNCELEESFIFRETRYCRRRDNRGGPRIRDQRIYFHKEIDKQLSFKNNYIPNVYQSRHKIRKRDNLLISIKFITLYLYLPLIKLKIKLIYIRFIYLHIIFFSSFTNFLHYIQIYIRIVKIFRIITTWSSDTLWPTNIFHYL